jgi:hypothetical protein
MTPHEQLKESFNILFSLYVFESHSFMERLFGMAQIALYEKLSEEEIEVLKANIPLMRADWEKTRNLIRENMVQILNSQLLKNEIKESIEYSFEIFAYESQSLIAHILAIAELALSGECTTNECEELENQLLNTKEKDREGQKIVAEKLKEIEMIVNVVT